MKTPVTVYVEVDDAVKFRELHLNTQEVLRQAIKDAIQEALDKEQVA